MINHESLRVIDVLILEKMNIVLYVPLTFGKTK